MDELEGKLETATRMYLAECTDHRATLEEYKRWRARAEGYKRIIDLCFQQFARHGIDGPDVLLSAYEPQEGGDVR